MTIYTDDIDFAAIYFPEISNWQKIQKDSIGSEVTKLYERIFGDRQAFRYAATGDVSESEKIALHELWNYIFIVRQASRSHYDILAELCRGNEPLPHGILCLAGSSDKLHGFKNRTWAGLEGNLHLVAYFSPDISVKNYGPGFMVLATVSSVQAIDDIADLAGRSQIKWVNDIIIEQAKICGVLAYSQAEGDIVTGAVLGIGLNTEVAPEIKPTPFVPQAACLRDFSKDNQHCHQGFVFRRLQEHIARNFLTLCRGKYEMLLSIYRERSAIIGRKVEIWPDFPNFEPRDIESGTVRFIGENLELYLEGADKPIARGRLVLKA